MTKEELLEKLKALSRDNDERDPEETHPEADRLLIEYINDADIAAAYKKVGKWYA